MKEHKRFIIPFSNPKAEWYKESDNYYVMPLDDIREIEIYGDIEDFKKYLKNRKEYEYREFGSMLEKSLEEEKIRKKEKETGWYVTYRSKPIKRSNIRIMEF